MEKVSLITDDRKLLAIFTDLLLIVKEGIKEGKPVFFMPSDLLPPGQKSNYPGNKQLCLCRMKNAKVDADESMRLLGVTLYQLVAGKSEYADESYLLDGDIGYRRPLYSSLWPEISCLLRYRGWSMEDIEKMHESLRLRAVLPTIHAVATAKVNAINNQSANKVADGLTGKISAGGDRTSVLIRDLAAHGLKLINHEQVADIWGLTIPTNIRIRYSEASLYEELAANSKQEQWILGYYSGQSLRQMARKLKAREPMPPRFYEQNWWLLEQEDFWATRNLEPGYYLINFHGKFVDKNWDDQEERIKALGSVYERCHEFVIAELLLSNFLINRGERLMKDWFHLGKEVVADWNHRVKVGAFGPEGLMVCDATPWHALPKTYVVVSRKFDFD